MHACLNRKRIEREKDEGLRDAARETLKELEESLSQGLALVSSEREHPGIKPQADTGNYLPPSLSFTPLPPRLCLLLPDRTHAAELKAYLVYILLHE